MERSEIDVLRQQIMHIEDLVRIMKDELTKLLIEAK